MKNWKDIQGWLGSEEAHLLQKYAREQQEKFNYDLLEIGSWKGRSSMAIASVLKDDHRLWMVDHFYGGPDVALPRKPFFKSEYHRHGQPWAYPELLQAVVNLGMEDRVIILPMTSQQASKIVEEKFSFIFIDGNHSYEGISSDWNYWSPHLIPGGACLFHDVPHPPIGKFISELKKHSELKEEMRIQRTIVFRRLN